MAAQATIFILFLAFIIYSFFEHLVWGGNLLLQLVIPLLILAQVHWVAQELYLHQS